MHVHLAGDRESRQVDFPLFLANGLTGVRDMWGDCTSPCASDDPRDTTGYAPPAATVQLWKHDVAAGVLLGPRIVAARWRGPGAKRMTLGSSPQRLTPDSRMQPTDRLMRMRADQPRHLTRSGRNAGTT